MPVGIHPTYLMAHANFGDSSFIEAARGIHGTQSEKAIPEVYP